MGERARLDVMVRDDRAHQRLQVPLLGDDPARLLVIDAEQPFFGQVHWLLADRQVLAHGGQERRQQQLAEIVQQTGDEDLLGVVRRVRQPLGQELRAGGDGQGVAPKRLAVLAVAAEAWAERLVQRGPEQHAAQPLEAEADDRVAHGLALVGKPVDRRVRQAQHAGDQARIARQQFVEVRRTGLWIVEHAQRLRDDIGKGWDQTGVGADLLAGGGCRHVVLRRGSRRSPASSAEPRRIESPCAGPMPWAEDASSWADGDGTRAGLVTYQRGAAGARDIVCAAADPSGGVLARTIDALAFGGARLSLDHPVVAESGSGVSLPSFKPRLASCRSAARHPPPSGELTREQQACRHAMVRGRRSSSSAHCCW